MENISGFLMAPWLLVV